MYSLEPNFSGKLVGPSGNPRIDEIHLLAVASVHGRPQGEILQAIRSWVISPLSSLLPTWGDQSYCSLLTREEV
jgi:hypothetical protein